MARTRPRPRPCRSRLVWQGDPRQSRKFLFVIIYFGVSNKHHTSSVHEACFICDFSVAVEASTCCGCALSSGFYPLRENSYVD